MDLNMQPCQYIMTPDICCVMEKAGEMWNNVVLLTKRRANTTWVHTRYKIQASRVELDISGSGDTHSHDDSWTAVFDTVEEKSGGSGNAIVNEALFLSEKRKKL
jgi:hypothetical protein